MRGLLIVVPSRGRPASIARLHAAMAETCTADTVLAVGLDDDDEHNYGRLPGIEYEVRAGMHLMTAWANELAVPRAGRFRAIGVLGDDNVPRTPGWDARVLAALEDDPFTFGNDLYPREPGSMSCHIFMRSGVVRALGHIGAPEISHMYVDVGWFAWGTATSISYLDDVIIDHLHYSVGKSAPDAVYATSYACQPADLGNWHAYSRSGRLNADVVKLGGRPYTPESLRAFNASINIPE